MATYLTFAEALRALMSKRRWTCEALAGMVGYKSKTSVVRILQEKSSPANRELFLERLCSAHLLAPDEEALLRDALHTSSIGRDQARARGILYGIIRGCAPGELELSAEFKSMLELLEQSASAQIMLVNCMWPQLAERLSDLLAARAQRRLEHLFTLRADGASAANALSCTTKLAYLPNYQGYALSGPDAEAHPLRGANMLCATLAAPSGEQTDMLIVIDEPCRAHAHMLPAQQGLFAFWRAAFTEAARSFRPVTNRCDAASGPESFVSLNRAMRDCERRRTTYQIAPDFCAGLLPVNCLRDSLAGDPLRKAFGRVDSATLERLLDEFVDCQRQRYEYMFASSNVKHILLSTSALRRFALTGMLSSHFQAMRPFTPDERRDILSNVLKHALSDPHFHLYLFRNDFCPACEITCWENCGMVCMPIDRRGTPASNYCCNIVRHPQLVRSFISYFKDVLLPNCTLDGGSAVSFLRELIARLERGTLI